jgi:hypothetical protein
MRQRVCENGPKREENCVNHGRDAAGGGSQTTKRTDSNSGTTNTQAEPRPDDKAAGDDAPPPEPVDQESPGATIDDPTPAEPNEPA